MLAQQERPTSPLHAVSQTASTSPAAQLARPNTVKASLTPKRPRRQVENDEYGAFVRPSCRPTSRVGDGDVEALVVMGGLADEIAAIADAVKGLRAYGYSWAEIGSRLGITRQAAQQRWGGSSWTQVVVIARKASRKRQPIGQEVLMYGGLVRSVVKAGRRDEFLELLRWDTRVAKDCEPGTLRLDVWEVERESNVVYVYEVYTDVDAFEEHTQNQPVRKFSEIMSSIIEDWTMVIPFSESVTSNQDE
jgi:(4S)-4-hydroxy-5-phosphonooxypentane-2,3-dione isomerase